jgi:hypothetical protein
MPQHTEHEKLQKHAVCTPPASGTVFVPCIWKLTLHSPLLSLSTPCPSPLPVVPDSGSSDRFPNRYTLLDNSDRKMNVPSFLLFFDLLCFRKWNCMLPSEETGSNALQCEADYDFFSQ